MTVFCRLQRALMPVNTGAWNLTRGIKGAFACGVPMLAAQWQGYPILAWSGLIGFWAILADPGGPLGRRLTACGAFVGVCSMGCGLAVFARDSIWFGGVFALLWCVPAILACLWGEVPGTIGVLSATAVLIVLSAYHPATSAAAWQMALLTAGGGFWGMAVTLAIGRQRSDNPLRAALASVFRGEAAFMRELCKPGPPAQQRGTVRVAIEAARRQLTALNSAHPAAQHGSLLLADAEGLLRALLALREARQFNEDQTPQLKLLSFAAALEEIASALTDTAHVSARASPAPLQASADPDGMLQGVAVWIAAAERHLAQAEPSEAPVAASSRAASQERLAAWVAPLHNNLSWRSISLRYAARFALTGALLTMLIKILRIEMGHWITITAVMVLQAYPSATWQRSIQRVGGAVLGSMIAVVAALTLHGPVASLVAIAPLSLLAMAARSRSYTIYVIFSTPLFMLLVEFVDHGGVLPPAMGGVRILYNLLGAAAGMAATVAFWPSWEASAMRRYLAETVRCNAEFLQAAFAQWQGAPPSEQAEEALRLAGLAGNNAEASLRRALDEPRRYPASAITAAMTITLAARRLAGIGALLQELPPASSIITPAEDFSNFVHAAARELAEAIALSRTPALPTMPTLPEKDRTTQLLHGVLQQFRIIAEAAGNLQALGHKPRAV